MGLFLDFVVYEVLLDFVLLIIDRLRNFRLLRVLEVLSDLLADSAQNLAHFALVVLQILLFVSDVL